MRVTLLRGLLGGLFFGVCFAWEGDLPAMVLLGALFAWSWGLRRGERRRATPELVADGRSDAGPGGASRGHPGGL